MARIAFAISCQCTLVLTPYFPQALLTRLSIPATVQHTQYACHSFFIHSPVDGHAGFIRILVRPHE